MNISYIFLFLFTSLLIYYFFFKYNLEPFNNILNKAINIDIHNSIFNINNPYTIYISTSTVDDIMKQKCYYDKYDYLSYLNGHKYKEMDKISNTSHVQSIQLQYIKYFFEDILSKSKNDELYMYYNKKLQLRYIYDGLSKYFGSNKYDNMSYLELMHLICINEQIVHFIDNINRDDRDDHYNKIMLAADYTLKCIKMKDVEKYKNITLNSSVFYIKNFIIYDNNEDYFNSKNYIFSCV